MVGKLYKNCDIRPVDKKDIPEKPLGDCINPPPLVPARVKNSNEKCGRYIMILWVTL